MNVSKLGMRETPSSAGRRRSILFYLKVGFSLCLLFGLLLLVDLRELFERSKDLNVWWLLLCVPLLLLSNFVQALSIRVLLRERSLDLWRLTEIAFFSWALGTLTPSRVGEYSAVYYLKKMGVSSFRSIACTFFLQVVTLLLYGILAVCGLFLMLGTYSTWLIVFVSLGVLTGVILLFFQRKVVGLLYERLPRRYFIRYVLPLHRMIRGLRDPRRFIAIIGLQGLRIGFPFLVFQCVLWAVHSDAPFFMIVAVNSLARIGSLLPISVGGLGVRESIQFGLFVKYAGITGGDVIAAAFWSNVLCYGLSFGAIGLLRFNRSN